LQCDTTIPEKFERLEHSLLDFFNCTGTVLDEMHGWVHTLVSVLTLVQSAIRVSWELGIWLDFKVIFAFHNVRFASLRWEDWLAGMDLRSACHVGVLRLINWLSSVRFGLWVHFSVNLRFKVCCLHRIQVQGDIRPDPRRILHESRSFGMRIRINRFWRLSIKLLWWSVVFRRFLSLKILLTVS